MCRFFWDSECHSGKKVRCEDYQTSYATVEWDIPNDQEAGIYRLVHYGNAKYPDGVVEGYSGMSRPFTVGAYNEGIAKKQRRHGNRLQSGEKTNKLAIFLSRI